jgi:hypothetical protein
MGDSTKGGTGLSGNQNKAVDRVEILSWLETIQRNFDPLLLKGRNRFNEAGEWIWIGIWLVRSFIGVGFQKMPEDNINKFLAVFSSWWQTWVTYLGLFGVILVPHVSDLQFTFTLESPRFFVVRV